MDWKIWLVIGLLTYVVISSGYKRERSAVGALVEKFTTPPRADIGYARDGWTEDSGYVRDLRYSETFADVQGLGVAADFCRAVAYDGDPGSLHMACALGRRDGMDNMEYRGRSQREGFRFSRDDYWRRGTAGRMDYCRIVRDEVDGTWYSTCAVAGPSGFKTAEERDASPPPAIRQLLEAYEGIAAWYRWFDDGVDYAGNTEYEVHGRPTLPSELQRTVSRGAQFNREGGGGKDYIRWGEPGALALDQTVQPRQIRAIAFWVYMDAHEKGTRVLECSADGGKRDLMWIGVEGGEPELPGLPAAEPAQEIRPAAALAAGAGCHVQPMQRGPGSPGTPKRTGATWVFEMWDTEQRIMRLAAPGYARTGTWQHVVVTTAAAPPTPSGPATAVDWWPTWQLWIDGECVVTKPDGRTSPALSLTHNYIGRNLRGCIQDFRVYTTPMTPQKIAAAVRWGRQRMHPSP